MYKYTNFEVSEILVKSVVNYQFLIIFLQFSLPEHLISPLVFIEVHVVLSFVSPYFML